MINSIPLACFLSMIRPPGVQFENALLQIAPVDKTKCPLVRDSSDVGFRLYTRYNPTSYQELVIGDDERLLASHMDFHDNTVFFFHAFMEMPDDGSAVLVREAYMLRGNVNVIMVDASQLEAGPWYFTAADNTWYIGRFAAKMLDYLVSRGLDLSKTHLVGHSLGAQAAGVAGAFITTGRVSRITGLDPALPLFAKLPLEQRLDPSDADFVDVIHTDAGIFGVNQPTGHADFYPNGGISPQPGCELEVVLPQQQFLNKCDPNMKPQGYYIFELQPLIKHEKNQTHITQESDSTSQNDIKELHSMYNIEQGSLHHKKRNTLKYHDVPDTKYNTNTKDSRHFPVGSRGTDVDTQEKTTDSTYLPNRSKSTHLNTQEKDFDSMTTETETHVDSSLDLMEAEADLEAILTRIQLTKFENKNTKQEKTYIPKKFYPSAYTDITTKTLLELFPNTKTDLDSTFQLNSKESHSTFKANSKESHSIFQVNSKEPDSTVKSSLSHVRKRQKRFINFFQKSDAAENENFLFRILEFVNKNRRHVIPVFTVMREINTLVKSSNGELNHSTKERNNYIGHNPPILPLATYNLELGSDSKVKAFVKRLLGLKVEGDRLSITGK